MEIAAINDLNINEMAEKAAELLRAGEVIALPTDTVYGLAADARSEAAITKVFALKGRAAEKALPVFVSSAEMLDEVAYVRDVRVGEFLAAVWPGRVTCVLPARGWLPLSLRGGLLTIAVRIPDDLLVRKVVEKFGGPITGTSANVSGHKPCSVAENVVEEFKHLPLRPTAIFDNGKESATLPSTIVDCTNWPPQILRQGAVSENDIIKKVNEINEG